MYTGDNPNYGHRTASGPGVKHKKPTEKTAYAKKEKPDEEIYQIHRGYE